MKNLTFRDAGGYRDFTLSLAAGPDLVGQVNQNLCLRTIPHLSNLPCYSALDKYVRHAVMFIHRTRQRTGERQMSLVLLAICLTGYALSRPIVRVLGV